MGENQTVVDRERDFHNARFGQDVDPREALDKWYVTIRHGADEQNRLVVQLSKGKDVLEYGCADGGLSIAGLSLPTVAKSVVGIDISDVTIKKAEAASRKRGYTNCSFHAMDAEAMSFADGSFDVVFGRGIIHHLDLDRCYSEVARVLRPGGHAVFYEPLGHNPVLNAYRGKTPDLRTPDEHPLLLPDFDLAKRYFSALDVTYFGLATVPSAVLPKALRPLAYQVGRWADAVLLKIPGIRKYAWYSLMVLTK